MTSKRMPDSVLTAVARQLDLDETDIIIMAPYRKKIRTALTTELKKQGYI